MFSRISRVPGSDATAISGPFGYYRIESATEGTAFTLSADHPAYTSSSTNEAALTGRASAGW